MSRLNLSAQYTLNPLKHLNVFGITDNQDQTIIFTSFSIPETQETVSISFWGAENYVTPVTNLDSLIVQEQYLGEKEGDHYYQYILNTDFPLIAVEMATTDNAPSLIKEVYFDPSKLDILLLGNQDNLPLMQRWMERRSGYQPTDMDLQDLDVFVTYYSHNFPPASPPMSEKPVSDKVILPDSSFLTFDNSIISLRKEGFYLFQEDTTSGIGFGWRLEGEGFPKPNQISGLIQPLRYISTSDEWKDLVTNEDKSTFDKFWLNLGRNPNIAKSMIRKFYSRVEYANKYFTTYKEGWKTDRGMIYLVYGAPDEVYRDESGEIWWYITNGERESFRFLRFSHVFYPYNYVLDRDPAYRGSWFARIEQLRSNLF
ncbi:MAG: GWxTD domain-containing protein [Candidatus Cyclobacteriaceae bacterium M2_1C_046]